MNKPKDEPSELIDMLDELDGRLEKITEDVQPSEQPIAKDFEQQVTDIENDHGSEQSRLSAQSLMDKVKRAFTKIGGGGGGGGGGDGICVDCGQQISEERLQILPNTNKCIECADE